MLTTQKIQNLNKPSLQSGHKASHSRASCLFTVKMQPTRQIQMKSTQSGFNLPSQKQQALSSLSMSASAAQIPSYNSKIDNFLVNKTQADYPLKNQVSSTFVQGENKYFNQITSKDNQIIQNGLKQEQSSFKPAEFLQKNISRLTVNSYSGNQRQRERFSFAMNAVPKSQELGSHQELKISGSNTNQIDEQHMDKLFDGKEYNIAVCGATGNVGRKMLEVLEERNFPIKNIKMLASEKSVGQTIKFRGETFKVELAQGSSFKNTDIALFSAGGETSKILAPQAANVYGTVVIDNSSHWRMHPNVPLVVPEVNPQDILNYKKMGIIANPNCSTIQMVVALQPLHSKAGLKRVVVSTYQAVSGAGKAAIDELNLQANLLLQGKHSEIVPKKFSKQIGFNCIPQIDVFAEEGFTKEEWKMMKETQKIMGLPNLKISATAVRVPVFNGHAESVLAEFENKLTADECREILKNSPGITLIDDVSQLQYPTQAFMDNKDPVGVGRIRNDPSCDNGIAFWCVADNIRKGAATNAVQIAEEMIKMKLL